MFAKQFFLPHRPRLSFCSVTCIFFIWDFLCRVEFNEQYLDNIVSQDTVRELVIVFPIVCVWRFLLFWSFSLFRLVRLGLFTGFLCVCVCWLSSVLPMCHVDIFFVNSAFCICLRNSSHHRTSEAMIIIRHPLSTCSACSRLFGPFVVAFLKFYYFVLRPINVFSISWAWLLCRNRHIASVTTLPCVLIFWWFVVSISRRCHMLRLMCKPSLRFCFCSAFFLACEFSCVFRLKALWFHSVFSLFMFRFLCLISFWWQSFRTTSNECRNRLCKLSMFVFVDFGFTVSNESHKSC